MAFFLSFDNGVATGGIRRAAPYIMYNGPRTITGCFKRHFDRRYEQTDRNKNWINFVSVSNEISSDIS